MKKPVHELSDRNFDDLADRFEQRIHNSVKGEMRQAVIWRDLISTKMTLKDPTTTPLKILDLGGGIGYFTHKFAALGHKVTYVDISSEMLNKAQRNIIQSTFPIEWFHGAYQDFLLENAESYDLILCHALLEWLAEPEQLIPSLQGILKPQGLISLCCYNPAGLTFHNLLRGNFLAAEGKFSPQANNQGFTPTNSTDIETVKEWISLAKLETLKISGIRVFSDYAPVVKGGLKDADEVLSLEMKYSEKAPYKWMGRYLHFLLRAH